MQYLDQATLKTQFIQTKEDSEFNSLLKLKDFIHKKKQDEIITNLSIDIMESIRNKNSKEKEVKTGFNLLKKYMDSELDKLQKDNKDNEEK